MYKHYPHHSGNESSENKSNLKIILNEIRSCKINTKAQFAIVKADLRTLRNKEERNPKTSISGT